MAAWQIHSVFALGATILTMLIWALLPRRADPVTRLLIAHFAIATAAPIVLPAVDLPWLEFGVDFDFKTGIRLLFPQTLVVFLLVLRLTRRSGDRPASAGVGVSPTSSDEPVTPVPTTPSSSSPWVRFWSGDIELGHAFWGWWGLAGHLVELVRTFVTETLDVEPAISETTYWNIHGAIHIPWVIANVLFMVAVWRSARRRVRERHVAGRWAVWARATQCIIVLSGVWVGYEAVIVGYSIREQIREAPNDRNAGRWALRLMRDGTELELIGDIATGLARDVERTLRENPRLRVVHLDSPGGSAFEGIRIRARLRARGIDTLVTADCSSACTLIYVAGKTRWIGPQGRLGFHDVSAGVSPNLIDRVQAVAMRQEMSRLYTLAGVESGFVRRAMATPSASILVPTTQELLDAKVVTQRAEPDRFAISGLGSRSDVDVFVRRLALRLPFLHVLEGVYDDDYDNLVAELADAWKAGKSDAELSEFFHGRVAELATSEISDVDPALVVEADRLAGDTFAELAVKDPGRCPEVAAGRSREKNRLPVGDLFPDRRRALAERVILGRAKEYEGLTGAQTAAARRAFLAAARRDLAPDVTDIVIGRPNPDVPPADICRAWAKALARSLDWSHEIRLGLVLRFGL